VRRQGKRVFCRAEGWDKFHVSRGSAGALPSRQELRRREQVPNEVLRQAPERRWSFEPYQFDIARFRQFSCVIRTFQPKAAIFMPGRME
ncbi:MAG: hypothetical protein KDB01_23275, partial [Planctomycetaceae bacterium]|nr:hypothetical protein [Planctomycetaceae bacterium]